MKITSILTLSLPFLFSGCMTLSGNYRLNAYNDTGEHLSKNIAFNATGSGIYAARNGLCAAFPKSTIIIIDTKTNEQLADESPYKCNN